MRKKIVSGRLIKCEDFRKQMRSRKMELQPVWKPSTGTTTTSRRLPEAGSQKDLERSADLKGQNQPDSVIGREQAAALISNGGKSGGVRAAVALP